MRHRTSHSGVRALTPRRRNSAQLLASTSVVAVSLLLDSAQSFELVEVTDVTVSGAVGSPWLIDGLLVVGGTRAGNLRIENGGVVENRTSGTERADGIIGREFSGSGTVTVTGPGSQWKGPVFIAVGRAGKGILNIDDFGAVQTTGLNLGTFAQGSGDMSIFGGGKLTTDTARIADAILSKGNVTIRGLGSEWINRYFIVVGSIGTGTLSIEDGARVRTDSVPIASDARASGRVTIKGTAGSRGVLEAQKISKGSGTANLLIDGGILRARGSEGQFLSGFPSGSVVIGDGGAFIDTGIYDIGIPVALAGTGSGTDKLVKQGSGTLTLSGYNAYSGGTVIEAGTLVATANANLGSGQVTNNGILTFQNTGWNFDPAISGSGALRKEGTGALTLNGVNLYTGGTVITGLGAIHTHAAGLGSGGVTIGSSSYLRVDAGTDATFTAGPLQGAGRFLKGGAGTLTLSRANPYSGAITVLTGTLALGGTGSISGSALQLDAGTAFDVSAAAGTSTLKGLTGGPTATLRLGGRALALDLAGINAFEGTVTGDGGQLIKRGAGTLTLTGSNDYSGGTSLEQGVILTHAFGLGTGAVSLGRNTLLTLTGTGDEVFAGGPLIGEGHLEKTGGGTLALHQVNSYSGGTSLQAGTIVTHAAGLGSGAIVNNGTLEIWQDAGADATFTGGPISGSGALIKRRAGTLTLDTVNTYTGDTTVADGTLALAGAGSIAASGLTLAGGVFDIAGASGDRIVAGLSGTGTGNAIRLGANTLIVDERGVGTYRGTIDGSGGLTKRGAGTLTLGGLNTYAGETLIEAGTLQVDGTVTHDARVAAGATLSGSGQIQGTVTVADGGTLAGGGDLLRMGALQLGAGALTDAILADASTPAFQVAGDLTLAGALRINPASALSYGSFRLFDYGGGLTDHGMALAAVPAGFQPGSFSLAAGAGAVDLVVSAVAGDQTWRGGAGTWSTGADWTQPGSSLATPWGGNTAIFGGPAGTVTVTGRQSFANLRFESDGYRLTAGAGGELALAGSEAGVFINPGLTASLLLPLTGPGRLAKSGAGTLVLADVNTYAGGTRIEAGTLVGTAASFGSGDIENHGILHVDQPMDGVLAAVISGSGELRKTGPGTLTLSGTNTYSGGTVISGGLKAAADANLGAPTGDLAFNDGTLVLGASFDLAAGRTLVLDHGSGTIDTNGHAMTVQAGLTGTATFVKDGLGTLTLRGPSTFTGTTIIAQGTLVAQADSLGSGPIDNRSALVIDQGTDSMFTPAIDGSGTLVKRGLGRLDLTGTSGLTGDTFVREGNLAVNGSLGQSHVTVGASAMLSGIGTVGGLAAQRGGTVAPGNSIGTLTVEGDVAFGAGSVYQAEVDAAGASDRITASGMATLTGGTVEVRAASGRHAPGTSYTILTAAGGVRGAFAGVAANFAYLDPTLSYGATDVRLLLTRKTDPTDPGAPHPVAFHSVAVSANQYRVADAVEALGEGHRLFDTVIGASAGGARQAFDALSGEAHASTATIAVADVQRVQDSILSHLRNEAETAPANVADPTLDPHRITFWGEGFGSWGQVRSNGNAAGMDASTGGFILGAETKIDESYRLGIAGGFMSTSFDIDKRLSSGTNETVFGSVYGAAKWDAINVRLGVLYGRNDVDVNRTIAFPGFGDRASASYTGSTLAAFGEVGYGFDLGQAKVEPFLGASVMRLHLDGFREDGGPAALFGYDRTYDLGTTTLGIRAETRLGTDLPLTLHGLAGWRHAFGNVNPSALLAFADSASAFTVAGIPVDRDALVAEAGLDWQITPAMTLGVSYAGQIGRRAQDHALKGTFNWRF
ncbi:autotransporter-associated beta strand repeat-containing protein [Microvirga sp. M2]|uniref:autotransporter-associated beta strand repeat-containing protein n=1 Tax=Microvirga sp. M2 TaxID=3073270 RepID=UPI0039C3FE5A